MFDAISNEGDVDAAREEAKRRLHEVVARLARIKLLFGEDAEAVTVAREILAELDFVRRVTHSDPTVGWRKLQKIYGLHAAFNAAAFEMISSPRWRVSSELEVRYRVAGATDGDDA